jgi:ribonuclease P/MRP protein subunit RPP1
MHFYDLHVHSAFSEGESSIEQLASMANELGYRGICFSEYFKNEVQIKKLCTEINKVKQKVGIEIFLGFEARSPKELFMLKERRKMFDVLLVGGGDLQLNREAAETPEVDILTHPELGRQDSGMNHVMMKLARKNNVAIEINFRNILIESKNSRSKLLGRIQNNIKLAKKFKVPIILCSGAVSHFEMRDPHVMISMATQLGLDLKPAKDALSKIPEKILKQVVERRDINWILPGVKVIE